MLILFIHLMKMPKLKITCFIENSSRKTTEEKGSAGSKRVGMLLSENKKPQTCLMITYIFDDELSLSEFCSFWLLISYNELRNGEHVCWRVDFISLLSMGIWDFINVSVENKAMKSNLHNNRMVWLWGCDWRDDNSICIYCETYLVICISWHQII